MHKGHVAFALQALKEAKLDQVYFLPEIQPRGKAGITHIGHRVAMLELALKPHPAFKVLELPESQFTTIKTLPKLKQIFGEDELLLLIGSNTTNPISKWPNVDRLLASLSWLLPALPGAFRAGVAC